MSKKARRNRRINQREISQRNFVRTKYRLPSQTATTLVNLKSQNNIEKKEMNPKNIDKKEKIQKDLKDNIIQKPIKRKKLPLTSQKETINEFMIESDDSNISIEESDINNLDFPDKFSRFDEMDVIFQGPTIQELDEESGKRHSRSSPDFPPTRNQIRNQSMQKIKMLEVKREDEKTRSKTTLTPSNSITKSQNSGKIDKKKVSIFMKPFLFRVRDKIDGENLKNNWVKYLPVLELAKNQLLVMIVVNSQLQPSFQCSCLFIAQFAYTSLLILVELQYEVLPWHYILKITYVAQESLLLLYLGLIGLVFVFNSAAFTLWADFLMVGIFGLYMLQEVFTISWKIMGAVCDTIWCRSKARTRRVQPNLSSQ